MNKSRDTVQAGGDKHITGAVDVDPSKLGSLPHDADLCGQVNDRIDTLNCSSHSLGHCDVAGSIVDIAARCWAPLEGANLIATAH